MNMRLGTPGEAGDEGLAIVKASTVNQDGRSSSLTAPNGPSQTALIKSAAAIAGIPPTLPTPCPNLKLLKHH